MASSMSIILFFACSFFLQGVLAEVICEDLSVDRCSFAIASSGKRCVLENYKNNEGNVEYVCKTSEVLVERLSGYIETDQCVRACGLGRKSVGISSDELLAPQFISSLCSPACYKNCSNIVDLYFNLAAGEGEYLPTLCAKQKASSRGAMLKLHSSKGATSSGAAPAPGATSAPGVTSAPAPF